MMHLSEEQLNNLGKDALVILVASLQEQLDSLRKQLDDANAHLADNNRQIQLLTEQICLMNQRHFGRKVKANLSEMDGQLTLFDSFNEVMVSTFPPIPWLTGLSRVLIITCLLSMTACMN